MSANTIVTHEAWRGARLVLAVVAGAIVSMVGATSTVVAWQGMDGFESAAASGRVDLQAAPAGAADLSEHSTAADAAELVDQGRTDGLHPGQAAYFGYVLGLGSDGAATASVAVSSPTVAGEGAGLSYEVRQVSDAQQCRSQWRTGQELVSERDFTHSVSPGFVVTRAERGQDPLQLCIRVRLAEDAGRVVTGSVTWKFVAAALS